MKKVLLSLFVGFLFLTVSSYAQTPAPAEAPAPAAAPVVKVRPPHRSHLKNVHDAIHKLRGAKADLQSAGHEFAGHKAKAIEAINSAIEELQAIIDSK